MTRRILILAAIAITLYSCTKPQTSQAIPTKTKYFRIKAVSKDGTFQYTPIRKVTK